MAAIRLREAGARLFGHFRGIAFDHFDLPAVAAPVQLPERKLRRHGFRQIREAAGGGDRCFKRQLRCEAGQDFLAARRRAGFVVDDGEAALELIDAVGAGDAT